MTSPEQIRAALLADAELAVLVAARIHCGSLPAEATLPAIVVSAAGLGEGPVSRDSRGGWERPRISCHCWAAQSDGVSAYGRAWQLAEAVKAALCASSLGARIISHVDLPEPEADLHRVVVDAACWTLIETREEEPGS